MRPGHAVVGLACAAALALITACGGGGGDGSPAPAAARPVPASVCGPITYGGSGRPRLLIVNSGPLQGPVSDHGVQNAQAAKLVLAQRRWRAGDFTVGVQVCDEAAAGSPVPRPIVAPRPAATAAHSPLGTCMAEEVSIQAAGPALGSAADGNSGRDDDPDHVSRNSLWSRLDSSRARLSRTSSSGSGFP